MRIAIPCSDGLWGERRCLSAACLPNGCPVIRSERRRDEKEGGMIRSARVEDATQLCEIYNHYVLHTPITFEEEAVSTAEMRDRLRETMASLPWLVWDEGEHVLGYCHASKWKGRCAYRYSVETTVYLRPDQGRRGIGTALYGELIGKLKEQGFHTALGGIALPNAASVALHERLGFEKVAQLREVGRKFGQWIDVGYWQLVLQAAEPAKSCSG